MASMPRFYLYLIRRSNDRHFAKLDGDLTMDILIFDELYNNYQNFEIN